MPPKKSNLDSYVLETGNSGAKRLNMQSELTNHLSFQHIGRAGLKEGDVVIDLGCGTGSMTEYLANASAQQAKYLHSTAAMPS